MTTTQLNVVRPRTQPQTQSGNLSTAQLIRGCGAALMSAGVLFALETLLHPPRDITTLAASMQQTVLGVSWNVSHTLGLGYFVIVLFGLLGLYVRQLPQMGKLGLSGFVLAFIGNALGIGVLVPDAYVFPLLARQPSTVWLLEVPGPLIPGGEMGIFLLIAGLTLVLGTTLFCIAGLRARMLPAWGFLLLAVGMPLTTFGPLAANVFGLIGATLGGAGYLWLGWALWAER